MKYQTSNPTLDDEIHYLTESYMPICKDDVIKFEQAIKSLLREVAEEVIGKDYVFNDDAFPTKYEIAVLESRNSLLSIQRAKLDNLLGSK